jgi:lipopolysaccharide cholinephosphotransferase
MLETYKNMRKVVDSNDKLYEISDTDRREIQETLVAMLMDVESFCNKHQLRYAVCGGSCLGAIRHQGFIPWDDDMDICMPRADYEKFVVLFAQDYSAHYWIQNIKKNPHYDLNFSKIRKKGTVFEEIYETEVDKAGIFIDIFPVDATYDNIILRTLHQMACDGMLLICSCVRMHDKFDKLIQYMGEDKGVKRSMNIKRIIGKCFSFLPLYKWLLLTESVISMCKNGNSKYVTIPSGIGHARGETYPRKWFFPACTAVFEGKKVHILSQPKAYLKKLYGDYMVVPPEEDRLGHNVVRYKNVEGKNNIVGED